MKLDIYLHKAHKTNSLVFGKQLNNILDILLFHSSVMRKISYCRSWEYNLKRNGNNLFSSVIQNNTCSHLTLLQYRIIYFSRICTLVYLIRLILVASTVAMLFNITKILGILINCFYHFILRLCSI